MNYQSNMFQRDSFVSFGCLERSATTMFSFVLADVFQPAERGPQVIELVQETLRGYHQRTDVLVVVQQAAVFPQQPLVSAWIDAVPLVEIFQQVLLLLLVHKSQADIQAVCQRGEYVQETEGRIILPFVTVGEIDVGYEQHDMAAQHADVHGKRGLLLRILHLGENIRRGFLDGIDQLPEFQIVVFRSGWLDMLVQGGMKFPSTSQRFPFLRRRPITRKCLPRLLPSICPVGTTLNA